MYINILIYNMYNIYNIYYIYFIYIYRMNDSSLQVIKQFDYFFNNSYSSYKIFFYIFLFSNIK